jgi:hypothetical protein
MYLPGSHPDAVGSLPEQGVQVVLPLAEQFPIVHVMHAVVPALA